MTDTKLMSEARSLVKFYDANGWNWESALAFTLCRDLFGPDVRCHPVKGYRCFPYPKVRNHGKSSHMD